MARTGAQDPDELPAFGPQADLSSNDPRLDGNVPSIELSSVPPAIVGDEPSELGGNAVASIPPAFTPSIKMTLNKPATKPGLNPIPLPDGLSVALLKSRLDSKQKIKYVQNLSLDESRHENVLLQRGTFDAQGDGRPDRIVETV